VVNHCDDPAIKLLDSMFEPQSCAFAVPTGSPLWKSISIGVLNAIKSAWWTQARFNISAQADDC
jgi:hypothetical protein